MYIGNFRLIHRLALAKTDIVDSLIDLPEDTHTKPLTYNAAAKVSEYIYILTDERRDFIVKRVRHHLRLQCAYSKKFKVNDRRFVGNVNHLYNICVYVCVCMCECV